uniref:hypothetical protein n=1 Tax=Thaumasiovibrio occultus TaxID=1891184 RepID=UPI00131C47AF|nr:hypothetical protein [Thaumasiovibrio occultus]
MKHRKVTNKKFKQMMHDLGFDDTFESHDNIVDNQRDDEKFSPPENEDDAK